MLYVITRGCPRCIVFLDTNPSSSIYSYLTIPPVFHAVKPCERYSLRKEQQIEMSHEQHYKIFLERKKNFNISLHPFPTSVHSFLKESHSHAPGTCVQMAKSERANAPCHGVKAHSGSRRSSIHTKMGTGFTPKPSLN